MSPCKRELFDIPDDVAYFNCAYMGPLSRAVAAAGLRGIEIKSRPWALRQEDFFTESDRARQLFAGIVGATADDIAIVPSASYGLAIAAANLSIEPGGEILCLQDQFPSNVYCWRDLATRSGGHIRTVTRDEARNASGETDWTPAVLDAISERTAIVALGHCHWTDGSLVDLVAVGDKTRAVGAALVLDVTQSLGALPLDIAAIDPDYLVAAAYKWLLGPYSLGFLYVAPRRHEGRPLEHNWIDREGSEDFAALVNYRDGFQPGARRYDMGERANFHLMPMAVAALEQLGDWGIKAIATTLSARTGDIAARAAALGYTSTPPELRAGHFLGLGVPGDPAAVLRACADEGVHVSVRGSTVRVTPHLYNTDADTERLLGALHSAAGRRR